MHTLCLRSRKNFLNTDHCGKSHGDCVVIQFFIICVMMGLLGPNPTNDPQGALKVTVILVCLLNYLYIFYISLKLSAVLLYFTIRTASPTCFYPVSTPEAVDMNGRFQMQGGKNWILPK